jgi:hypothetical protein
VIDEDGRTPRRHEVTQRRGREHMVDRDDEEHVFVAHARLGRRERAAVAVAPSSRLDDRHGRVLQRQGVAADGVTVMADDDDDVVEFERLERADAPLEKREATQAEHRLGTTLGQREHPRRIACGEDDGLANGRWERCGHRWIGPHSTVAGFTAVPIPAETG